MSDLFTAPPVRKRWMARLAATAIVGASVTPLTGIGAAQAGTSGDASRHGHSTASAASLRAHAAGHRLDAALRGARGQIDVMLELTARPAARAWAHPASGATTHAARTSASRQAASAVRAQQAAVRSHLGAAATKANVLYTTHALYSGVAVRTSASHLGALAALPGVKAVHKLVAKHRELTASVPLIGAQAAWSSGGNTGQGVSVGIIDTGIDYTHADFGGPGTVEAYDAARAAAAAPPVVEDGGFLGSKVVGGYDFAGDNYDPDADEEGESTTPTPDSNPMDCEGHGTHVAGIAAGYGVLEGDPRETYDGPYDNSLDESEFRVGPGVAPEADLYALKVFGCDGTTNLVADALDWAADPNSDGDLSDHLDVVNMSLGSDYSSPQDPDAVATNNASLLGISVVVSSGNANDLYDVGGAPGNATRALTVAASDDYQDLLDGLQVNSPDLAQLPGEESAEYDWKNSVDVTGNLETTGDITAPPGPDNNADGCDEITEDLTGKIAYFSWTDYDPERRCGSAGRTGNALDAGAIGAVFFDDENEPSAGIAGIEEIPAMLITKDAGEVINAELEEGPVNVTLTYDLHASQLNTHEDTTDTIVNFSSRGIGDAGNVKPDVAAPGKTIFSAGIGTGTDGLLESGTSMSAPHVAGVSALVRAAHPTWSPAEVKAAIMNTAGQDVTCDIRGENMSDIDTSTCEGDDAVMAPQRVGAGRVQANRATTERTLAYVDDNSGAVSVSFGPVAAVNPTTLSKQIKVVNTRGVQTVNYNVAYDAITSLPGVDYEVSPSQLVLGPGQSKNVTVTLTVDPDAMAYEADPTVNTQPFGSDITSTFIADASGRVLLTPSSSSLGELRVPVYAAPRPASAMTQPKKVAVAPSGLGNLPLSGKGVDNEDVSGSGNGTQADLFSTVDAFELQGTSPASPSCSADQFSGCVPFSDDRAGDLKYVGFASDAPVVSQYGDDPTDPNSGALAYFGIVTQGPWRTPASYAEYDVYIDVDNDGNPEAVLFNTRLTDTDIFVSELFNLETEELTLEGFINTADGSLDTNLFNSDALTMPVSIASLSQIEGTGDEFETDTHDPGRFSYFVDAFTLESGFTDSIGDPTEDQTPMSANMLEPGLSASDTTSEDSQCPDSGLEEGCVDYPTLNSDQPGVVLTVMKNREKFADDNALGLLLIHHDNTNGHRGQVVKVFEATSTRISHLRKNPAPYGFRNVATVRVSSGGGTPTGTVAILQGKRVLGTATLHRATNGDGIAGVKLPVLRVGKHTLHAVYRGDSEHARSTSPNVVLTVKKARTATELSVVRPAHPQAGDRLRLKATTSVVGAGSAPVKGKVTFFDNGVKLGAVTTDGSVKFRTPPMSAGKHVLKAVYGGSGRLKPSTGKHTVTL